MQGRFHVRARSVDVGALLTFAPMTPIIGIDGSRAGVRDPTGTERYAIELLEALAELDPTDNILVYFNADSPPAGVRFPGTAALIRGSRFWTLRTLTLELRRFPPALLFVPSHVIPPVHPASVVTIHDVGYLIERECHDPVHRRELEWTTRWNCHAASGIIAVSETTRYDLIQHLGIKPDKIRTIHHGVSPVFRPAPQVEVDRARVNHGLPDRFVLTVGTIHPRKNLERLIQSFERIAPEEPDLHLVLCGKSGWRGSAILDRARRSPFGQRIRHLGYIPAEDMPALYSAATATALISLYEGFGLPALESMACGTPVVAAARSALPEICADSALLVNPFDTAEISGGLQRLLHDQGLRRSLTESGQKRARIFTWQRCARETLAFLRAIRDNSY